VAYFLDTWKAVCPQIDAVVSASGVRNSTVKPLRLEPQYVKKFKMGKYMVYDPTGWREAFDIWLRKHAPVKDMSAETPIYVHQQSKLIAWQHQHYGTSSKELVVL
jgi:hypothetical protein